MYIYADESGHTGRHIFNPPTYYYQGAILSTRDIAPIVTPIINKYLATLHLPRLHANELRETTVATIALDGVFALIFYRLDL